MTRMISKYADCPQLSRNQVILHLYKDVDLELVYTVKAVLVIVYCPSSRRILPADEVLCLLCDGVRVTLIELLTQAKERGMVGFQFEVCVHTAVDKALLEYDPNRLASLDEYPENEILLNKEYESIDPPAKLKLWFDNVSTSYNIEGTTYSRLSSLLSTHNFICSFAVAADSVYDPDVVMSAVLQQGHDR